jgi:hypothetical protein
MVIQFLCLRRADVKDPRTESTSKVSLLYKTLAEIPGVARDSIKSEGIREINYGIVLKN